MGSSISIMKVGTRASEMTKGLGYSLMAERTVWAGVFTRLHFMKEAHGRVCIASSLHPDPDLVIRQTTHRLEDWPTILHILQEASREASLFKLGCCKVSILHGPRNEFLICYTVCREQRVYLA